ncbi:MAG: SnoK [Saprospiraceae bacterium]|nr:MAG: SnoK [Saprospiraceae bacterium]
MNRIEDLQDEHLQVNLKQSFEENGFIFFPHFLNEEEITSVKEKLADFIQNKVPEMPSEMVYYEDKSAPNTLKQLQRLFEFDDFFHQMMFDSRFEKLASILLNDKVVGKNIQYFNKPAKIGQETPAHQDGYYFMLEPNEAVTMWMALEDVDEENGCVRYVRGSHKKGIRAHGRTNVLGFSQGIVDFGTPEDLKNEVFFPTKAGDLLVHHSLTIHRADGNKSANRSRKAMGFIYYGEKAREDKAAHEAYAKKLSEDLAKEKKI